MYSKNIAEVNDRATLIEINGLRMEVANWIVYEQ